MGWAEWVSAEGERAPMTSQGGLSFSEGMVILIALGFDVKNGNYCVAKIIDTN